MRVAYSLLRVLVLLAPILLFSIVSEASIYRVNTNCENCLNLRDGSLGRTGFTIPRGTRIRVTGEARNGYVPAKFRYQGQITTFYLSQRYLRLDDNQSVASPEPEEDTSRRPSEPAESGVEYTRNDNYPASGSEAEKRAWVHSQLRYWISLSGNDLLDSSPRDMGNYCPSYSSLSRDQRVEMWASLMTKVSFYESTYNTHLTHTESFTDSTGARVVSTGLFQLSRESARGYGCPVNSTNDLKNPVLNTQCAVRIMNRWVGRDNLVGEGSRGGGRYWAVFRGTRSYTRLSRAGIMQASQEYCSNPTAPADDDAPYQNSVAM